MPDNKIKTRSYTTKKCPECFTYVPVKAKVCTACHAKIGDVDERGIAKKPVDIKAYIICIIACLALGFYIWWAFL